jgi:hypothetical protein
MIDQLKGTLVESFIGAIALGWLFAQAIYHFVSILAQPVASWAMRSEMRRIPGMASTPSDLLLRLALPELLRSAGLLLLGYLLLRWLYFKPLDESATPDTPQTP